MYIYTPLILLTGLITDCAPLVLIRLIIWTCSSRTLLIKHHLRTMVSLFLIGQQTRLTLRGRCRSALVWSAAGGACGLAATAPWGAYTVAVGGPAFGLSSALSGWRPRLSLRWFSWGPPDVWGPGLFRACFMPCGMGLLFPTHTIKHLHGGTLWTQARSHTQVYTQAFTLV